MRPTLFLFATLVSCGPSHPAARPAAPPPDRKAACTAGDMASCVEEARTQCTDHAWQIEFDRPPALYVTPGGLSRLDRLNMVMLSTNTSEWLACIDDCPGTGTKNVCIPFVLPMHFELDKRSDCQETTRDVVDWNGHPAKSSLRDCPGELSEITYVPDLEDVQHALIAAGTLDQDGPLDQPGLVVKLNVGGAPVMTIASVQEAACSVFDVPAGYTLVRGSKPFEEARAMQPELERNFHKAQAKLQQEIDAAVQAARSQVEPQVRKLCEENGYSVSDEESLATCTYQLEAARALLTKAVSEELERARLDAEPKLDAALRDQVIEPLCRKFAPAK